MKSDFSKDTFDVTKHFTRVVMQQGRVQLDADWNEQASILLHYLQTLATDLIGRSGGPNDSLGFEIGIQNQSSPPQLKDLVIGPGRYYVDGILCENDLPAFRGQSVSYLNQPSYRAQHVEHLPAPLLVYLDVWERHICVLEDPDIREVALGGPDTATRAKIVWQVRVFEPKDLNPPLNPPLKPADVTCAGFEETDLWKNLMKTLQPPDRSHLRARAFVPEDSDEPCVVSPAARYRGAENQLYRVEIHRGSANGHPTFKWSRENGSVVFPIQRIGDKSVTLENLGRDDRFGLDVGDWVEVVDDDYTLLGTADPLLRVENPLLRVKNIETDTMLVTLSGDVKGNVGQDPRKHPFLRRWDQQKGDPKTGGLTLENDNAAKIIESNSAWLNLEDGVQIQFQIGGNYRTGDYWLIPARTETGDVEWPGDSKHPEALPPHGVEHHYAPLALVLQEEAKGAKPAAFGVTDLRHRFAPVAHCCPRITVDVLPPTNTPRQATFTVRVNPPDPNLRYSWSVTGGPTPPGSNTPSPSNLEIKVTAAGTGATEIIATVTIEGLPAGCPNTFAGRCEIK